ncbi:SRPBCC family protein [Halomarina ordinaria]|uniref:SRPBCC family protein n=1 Tax=Halomarina ordinaria TaxID=3033939 RepID=A0ABD5UEX6_9EURY|nr:SRPBCC family protein [Halomarina sp. PSRA2]
MTTIRAETFVAAPPERVFDLTRCVSLREDALTHNHLHAVAGVGDDLLSPGTSVVWQTRLLGMSVALTMRLATYNRPRHFRERMVDGPFERLIHDRFFEPEDGGTLVRDVLTFESPLGGLGEAADAIYLERFFRDGLDRLDRAVRDAAESDDWRRYLAESA